MADDTDAFGIETSGLERRSVFAKANLASSARGIVSMQT